MRSLFRASCRSTTGTPTSNALGDAGLPLRVAARSEEEARSIGTTQAVIPVELHAVKNGYGPLTAGAPSPLRIQAWPTR